MVFEKLVGLHYACTSQCGTGAVELRDGMNESEIELWMPTTA